MTAEQEVSVNIPPNFGAIFKDIDTLKFKFITYPEVTHIVRGNIESEEMVVLGLEFTTLGKTHRRIVTFLGFDQASRDAAALTLANFAETILPGITPLLMEAMGNQL